MKRRAFMILLAGGAAAGWPVAARAQQPMGKVYRIGVLELTPAAQNTANLGAFRAGLRDLGYVEGENLIIDYRSIDGHLERIDDFAAELIRGAPDVIVTRGTAAALAAKNATATIPVVMAAIGEPLRVVDTLARPGGNITGLSAMVFELEGKRVELLTELRPGIKRIGALTNPDNPGSADTWRELAAAARSTGIKVQPLLVRTAAEIEPAFAAASREGAEALFVEPGSLTRTNAGLIAELAARHRLPAIYSAPEFVEAGGLIFYGVDYVALYRRAALYVAKILKGAKPADLPIEQPTLFKLVVNLKAAKALGMTIPPSVLLRADEVIE
jgi:putative ABC transport system substrate-binding protein